MRCAGDGLRPRIKPGEYGIYEPTSPIHPGDEAAIRLKNGIRMMVVVLSWRDGVVTFMPITELGGVQSVHESEIERKALLVGVVHPREFHAIKTIGHAEL